MLSAKCFLVGKGVNTQSIGSIGDGRRFSALWQQQQQVDRENDEKFS